MSAAPQDLEPLRKTLEQTWASLWPEADAFHKQRRKLANEMNGFRGSFPLPDAAAIAAAIQQYHELERVVALIRELVEISSTARAAITDLLGRTPPRGPLRAALENQTGEWLLQIDHFVRFSDTPQRVESGKNQARTIVALLAERKSALETIAEASTIESTITRLDRKGEIQAAIRDWSAALVKGSIKENWREREAAKLQSFRRYRDEEAVSSSSAARSADEAPVLTAAWSSQTTGREAQIAPQQRDVHDLPEVLSKCRRLAEILKGSRADIDQLNRRLVQVLQQAEPPRAELDQLHADVHACWASLTQKAAAEVTRRLQRVQARLRWVNQVYGVRPDIAAKVQQAASPAPSDAPIRDWAAIATASRISAQNSHSCNAIWCAARALAPKRAATAVAERKQAWNARPRSRRSRETTSCSRIIAGCGRRSTRSATKARTNSAPAMVWATTLAHAEPGRPRPTT